MLLTDHQIRRLCEPPHNMITPFSEAVRDGVISYGLTSAGYDLRLASEVMVYKDTHGLSIDPKQFRNPEYVNKVLERIPITSGYFIIPSRGYVLGKSFEYLRIPKHLKGRCVGKSTLARCGLIVNTTPLEPGWHGYLTIELANAAPCPLYLPVLEGICQLEFELLDSFCEVDYQDKKGIYQGQQDVTPPRVMK